MTALQKALAATVLVAAVGTGIYEACQAFSRRSWNETLRQQQTMLAEQVRQAQQERDEASQTLAALRADNERLNRNAAELLKLRAEVTQLKANATPRAPGSSASQLDAADTAAFQRAGQMLFQAQDYLSVEGKLFQMDQRLHLSSEQQASVRDILKRDPRLKKTRAELEALFTPDQQAAYEQFEQETERDRTRIIACVNALDVLQLLQAATGLDQKQQEAAFPALVEYGQQKALYDEGKGSDSDYLNAQKHLNQLTLDALKPVLSDGQMAIYQKYQEQMLRVWEMQVPSKTH